MINLASDKHEACLRWRPTSPTFEQSIHQDVQDLISLSVLLSSQLIITKTEIEENGLGLSMGMFTSKDLLLFYKIK